MADPLIIRLRELAPFPSEHAAMRALEATVNALWLRLYPEEREKLAADLPSPIAGRLRAPSPHDPTERAHTKFSIDVARKEQIGPGLGIEHAEVVCRALSELLPAGTRTWLQHRLPEISDYLELPEPTAPPPYTRPTTLDNPSQAGTAHDASEGRTLATGRPGSARPLSSAR
jgi:uncharacterized protein (DUF2267 family)